MLRHGNDRPGSMTEPTAPMEITNRLAMAAWIFMAIWMGFVVLMTWVLHHDGPHPSQPAWLQQGAMAVFWLIGLPATLQAFAEPITRFRIGADGGATLTRRSLLWREEEQYPPGSIAAVEVREGRDGEGDPIFRSVLVAVDGRERLIREGPDLAVQEGLARQARTALGLA